MALRRGRRRGLDELDRSIVALAVPALGALAVEPLYVLADTAIVGRLGTTPLGGLAIASTVLNALVWMSNVLSFGTTSRVARLTGQGDHAGAHRVAAQGLWLCIVIGLPAAGGVALLARPVAAALGGRGEVLDAATTYLRISAAGIPFILVALLGHGWFRGRSDTRTPLRIVVVANLLNIGLEVLFVYGFHWGVAGSAWGTVAAQVVTACWFLALGVARLARPEWDEMRRLLVIGRDLFVRTAALLSVLALSTAVAARVSPATLGGHQIALQFFALLALSVDALAITAQAMVGTRLGAGDETGALHVARRLVRIGLYVGAAVGLVVIALSPLVPHGFSADGRVVRQATAALVLLGALQVPAAIAFVLDGVLMGASDFRFLKWTTLAGALAFLPFAGAVLVWHRLGIVGIWAGLLVWMSARSVVSLRRFSRGRWAVQPLG
ncbi:MAG TPA: MATE family efflux transporter [Acidimicrobiales bacterium]|nr:MATE family efflux transporter [Acidimicrobiales bacterium]